MNKHILSIIGKYIEQDRPKLLLYHIVKSRYGDVYSNTTPHLHPIHNTYVKEAPDLQTLLDYIYDNHKNEISQDLRIRHKDYSKEVIMKRGLARGSFKFREITEY